LLNKYPGIVYRCNEQMLDDVTNDYNHMQLSEEELDD